MQNINSRPHVLNKLDIEVSFRELVNKIQTNTHREDILATAEKTLISINNIWTPSVVYRWLLFEESYAVPGRFFIHNNNSVILNLGYSATFAKEASYVLVAVFSIGSEIEKETQKASASEEFLVAYFIDLIGLLVLEKTGDLLKRLAEQKAADLGWGVSPFLSPGSIHGWELEDQLCLCSLLPLDKIGAQIRDDGVLLPFKSLSCLIGTGPGYNATQVGTTCQVCSKKDNCQMKQM